MRALHFLLENSRTTRNGTVLSHPGFSHCQLRLSCTMLLRYKNAIPRACGEGCPAAETKRRIASQQFEMFFVMPAGKV